MTLFFFFFLIESNYSAKLMEAELNSDISYIIAYLAMFLPSKFFCSESATS
jgi:hypothetical protein